jgi:hypothetical protein
MPLFRFGTSPADTTPILITNQELNSNGYDLFKGTLGYEDTILLADNVEATLLLQPNVIPTGSNARTFWVKDFNGVTQMSVDIITGITTINNLVVNGTASVGFVPGFGANIPTLIVQGNASLGGPVGLGQTTIVGPQNTIATPGSWIQSLIIDDLPGSSQQITEWRIAGVRKASIRVDSNGNLILNGLADVILSYDEGSGRTRFGGGGDNTTAIMDAAGILTAGGLSIGPNSQGGPGVASINHLESGPVAKLTSTVNTSFNPSLWNQAAIFDSNTTSLTTVTEYRTAGVRAGSIRTATTGGMVINGFGTGPVKFNVDEGTAGVEFYNGSGTREAFFDSSGNLTAPNVETLISTTTLLAPSATVAISIPTTFRHFRVVWQAVSTDATQFFNDMRYYFNGDLTNFNYQFAGVMQDGVNSPAAINGQQGTGNGGQIPGHKAPSYFKGAAELKMYNANVTATVHMGLITTLSNAQNNLGFNYLQAQLAYTATAATALNTMFMGLNNNASFDTGSIFQVYGTP